MRHPGSALFPRSAANIVSINRDCKIATRAIGGFRSSRPSAAGRWRRRAVRKSASQETSRYDPRTMLRIMYRGKPYTFDAPAHHFRRNRPAARRVRKIVAENATIAAGRRIKRPSHHLHTIPSRTAYDYIGKLMLHWAPNYTSRFEEDDFRNLLEGLKKKRRKKTASGRSSSETGWNMP